MKDEITIGKFTIRTDDGQSDRVAIEIEGGEGGEFSAAEFESMVDSFFWERF